VSVVALGESVNWTKAVGGDVAHVSAADRTERSAAVLAVGDTREWTARGRRIPTDGDVFFVEFHEVTTELLAHLAPRLVLSPLLARTFDCVDLAQKLGKLGYHGPYRAIDSGLPDPALIVREVRLLVPGLDFGVVPPV
jgi:hypothetical protein